MAAYLRTGSLGLLISFLGSLPIGTLNITAFYIASNQSTHDAIWFALAVVAVELVVVRFTLWGDRKISFDKKLFNYLLPFAAIVLLYLAMVTIFQSQSTTIEESKILFPAIQSTFLLGLLLSSLNPMHIPFWMSWNKVLSSKNSLSRNWKSYTSYIGGIGLGSMFGLMIFIYAGNMVFQNYNQYSYLINLLLGILYAGFAIYLLVLFYKKTIKTK